ncbi:hypothetical protein EMMF5_005590 [Cystobasidiomycetes sp. EMM_F5]
MNRLVNGLQPGLRANKGFQALAQQGSRYASTSAHGVESCGVIGAGQMGLGIAYVAARYAKVDVHLVEASQPALAKALQKLDALLSKDVSKKNITSDEAEAIRQRIKPVNSIQAYAEREVQLVMEAVSESLPVKQRVFSELATHCSPSTILATNTSSISIARIAASACSSSATSEEKQTSASRVIGLHWMQPVPVMKLVELIPCVQTNEEVLRRSKAFAETCGKQVTTSADTPGFLANRILLPYINEAIICLETGVGNREDLDTTAKLGFGHPMGPLTLADFIGLDTCLAIMQTLYSEFVATTANH